MDEASARRRLEIPPTSIAESGFKENVGVGCGFGFVKVEVGWWVLRCMVFVVRFLGAVCKKYLQKSYIMYTSDSDVQGIG